LTSFERSDSAPGFLSVTALVILVADFVVSTVPTPFGNYSWMSLLNADFFLAEVALSRPRAEQPTERPSMALH